jgi:hypothetical protein
MKAFVSGIGSVTLGTADFVGRGGEGAVYVKGELALKIFADAGRVLPRSKMDELAAIGDERVVVPTAMVLDRAGGNVIGYAMRRVPDAFPLGQLVARAFQDRNGIDHERLFTLVRELAERVKNVHRAGCLVVDLNELNFLVDRSFSTVFAIDCDSYQTPSHPATAIAAAVRDPLATTFTTASDWFSFSVVSFQLLVGVHPYKGTHPSVKGLEERMRRGLSVLGREVAMPPVAHPLAVIPEPLLGWYRAVLERGERTAPPGVPYAAVLSAAPEVAAGGGVALSLVAEVGGAVRAIFGEGTEPWIAADDGLYAGARRIAPALPAGAVVVPTPVSGRPLAVWVRPDGALVVEDVEERVRLEVDTRAEAITTSGGRVYAKAGDKLVELCVWEVGRRLGASTRLALSVLPHATRLHDGVAITSLLGACHAAVFPAAGRALWLRLPELDGERVIDARCDWPVLAVTVQRPAEQRRLWLRFREDGGHHDVREDGGGLRFVTLDRATCVSFEDDGDVAIFRARPGSADLRLVDGGGVAGAIPARHGAKVLCARGRQVYRVSTRSHHAHGATEASEPAKSR